MESIKADAAKYKLAEAVKECMKTTAVENITVKQIVEECGVSRQTFYRNFIEYTFCLSEAGNLHKS